MKDENVGAGPVSALAPKTLLKYYYNISKDYEERADTGPAPTNKKRKRKELI